MKTILTTMGLLLALTAATFAQTTETSQPPENKPIITEETKQEVREAAKEVKEDVRQKSQEIKQDVREGVNKLEENTRETRQDIKQGAKEAAREAEDGLRGEVNAIRSRNERSDLTWFDKGSVFLGASAGFGLGQNSGTYLVLTPRIGYFFLPGLAGGLRLGYDRRLSTSFSSNQVGVFARYYPFRTRVSGFAGAGYNIGREQASNINDNSRNRFNSITLEAGVMFYATQNFGVEASLETNYYDRSNPLAGRNRGGRAKVGINYYFARRVQ